MDRIILALLCIVGFCKTATADMVTITTLVERDGSGGYIYTYDIATQANSTFSLSSFDLELPADATVSSYLAPANWAFQIYESEKINSIVWEPPLYESLINPGEHARFELRSNYAPGVVDYTATYDDLDQLIGDFQDGTTIGPSMPEIVNPVPAPPAIALFGVGLVFSACWGMRHRIRKSRP